jgi:hypothetical protein
MTEPKINSSEVRELTSEELEVIAGGLLPPPPTPVSGPLPVVGGFGHYGGHDGHGSHP